MASDILDGSASWMRLALTLAIAIVANAGMWAIIVIMPAIEAELGLSRAEASLPYTLTMIGFGVGNFLVGRSVDKFGIVRTLLACGLGIAIGYWWATISSTVLMISLAQLLIGFCTSVGFGPLIADISHWFLKRRGIAVAIAASGNYLSGAIWPIVLSGVLADEGWRASYLYLALITLIVVCPLALTLRRTVPEAARQAAETKAKANRSSAGLPPRLLALLLGIAGVGCCVAMSMPQVHIVAYCVDLGYGPAVGAEMLSLMLLGGVASRVISGLVADKLGGVATLLIGSVLQCIALVLYLPSDALVSLYVVSMIFGLSQGGIVPSYAVIVREYMPARDAGMWVGLVLMATIMGMALGGWVSGWIYDVTGSYHMAFWNGILWNALNIGIILWLLLRSRPRKAVLATV